MAHRLRNGLLSITGSLERIQVRKSQMEKMHRAKAPMLSLSMLNKCFLKEGRCEKTPSTGQFERVKFSLTFLHFYLEKSSYDTVNFLTSKINLGNFLPVFLLQSQPFDLVAGEYRIRIFPHSVHF